MWAKSFCLLTSFLFWFYWARKFQILQLYSRQHLRLDKRSGIISYLSSRLMVLVWQLTITLKSSYQRYLKAAFKNCHVFRQFQTEGIHWPDRLSRTCFFVCTFKIRCGLNVIVLFFVSRWTASLALAVMTLWSHKNIACPTTLFQVAETALRDLHGDKASKYVKPGLYILQHWKTERTSFLEGQLDPLLNSKY